MLEVSAGPPLIQVAKLCYQANRSPMLIGPHGIGKSELMEQAAKELGIEFISCDLSLMEPSDLVGMPVINNGITSYATPSFLPREGRGLLLIEELNRAESYMRAPCLQLLTARRLNQYILPPGWLPAAAINPDGVYEVSPLDPALMSRFVCMSVAPSVREWVAWAEANDVHPAVIRYVRSDLTVFDEPDSNPRAWAYVSDLVRATEQGQFDLVTLKIAVVGTVGDSRGIAFLASMQGARHPLGAEDIFDTYETTHRPLVGDWMNEGRLDLLENTLADVMLQLQPQADYDRVRHNRPSWRNLACFLHDLPGDLHEKAKQFFDERDYFFPQRPRITTR